MVEKATHSSVWIKTGLALKKYKRTHVQLVPRDSEERKTYDDRPKLSDEHDPELKEKRPNVQQKEKSEEVKA